MFLLCCKFPYKLKTKGSRAASICFCIENSDEGGVLTKTPRLAGGSGKAFADEQSRRSGGSLVQRELSPQATEGLFLSCEFCNPSASRCSAPPFTQGRRKVVVVAFATAEICKCQTFSEGFQPCQYHCPYRAEQATGFAGGYDSVYLRKARRFHRFRS